MKFCPGHKFQIIEASNFKLHSQIYHIKDNAVYKNHKIFNLFHLFLELLPFVNLNFAFCPGHNCQSTEASNCRLYTQIDYIKENCGLQEP